MLYNNKTQEQKLVQAVELSDSEMEKVSGGVDENNPSGGYEFTDGGIRGYGNANGYGGYGGYGSNNGGIIGYGDYVVPGNS